ncbi:cell wall hydrolase [Halalkalibacterium ligniniphilum]|uniref:cell wall hydrolase n=1 Tax=Halalkalibacterium ligniniphilum TaxID=1134413 RepID=UPI00034993D1|nr:cell wall hydrolase [Halalkalibacterium ligniniphilum]
MYKWILAICLGITLTLISVNNIAEASTRQHTVSPGESLYNLSKQYGVPVEAIKRMNQKTSNVLYARERLTIPAAVTASERDLLARLVHAEAKGEPYAGKVAVATVVLNRVDSDKFPNSVREVIYEKNSGYYAFSPVKNGEINKPADAESHRAVEEALRFRGQGAGSLFFYNPQKATSNYVATRQQTIVIGNHIFAK